MVYLQERSSKGLLTEGETSMLSSLVKIRMLLKSKAIAADSDDPLADLSADQLKAIMEVLK